ncbi:hypothetical protein [Paraglaciecola chathamensis]|uniref:Uncharacterized protein n=1 Tax=Paraglaciecola agarilytica NO2 TaxID=1125747 RepID=A0ABQ0I350_9ALTE|nr:hypothetical protein [Paraglaciecola agarilytica]GAC03742.1 hypothetical protein GAGA_0879 [Paraglaciecola agarilytica NO2]
MAHIGSTDFYIGIPSLPREEFELYSTRLFDQWDQYANNHLYLEDYSLALDVEEGSIKASGRIVAALGVLYIGIGQYGSFISGLNTIHGQVKSVSKYLGEKAGAPFVESSIKPKVSNRGESLSRLKNIFTKVQSGDLSVEQAMIESETLFGDELDSCPEFKSGLQDSLEKTPVMLQQMPLALVDVEGNALLPEKRVIQRLPRQPKPKRPEPPADQLRVEVWRDTKKSKKNVRVTNLR